MHFVCPLDVTNDWCSFIWRNSGQDHVQFRPEGVQWERSTVGFDLSARLRTVSKKMLLVFIKAFVIRTCYLYDITRNLSIGFVGWTWSPEDSLNLQQSRCSCSHRLWLIDKDGRRFGSAFPMVRFPIGLYPNPNDITFRRKQMCQIADSGGIADRYQHRSP